jgi:hypothetical protein|tara:strand:+ start:1610 stop:2035 length:426 start_codon:yes stop_codon:yes gene_type:complete
MAYMSQEHKKKLSPAIKAVLKKYGVKGSIGVRHNSSLVVNIKEGVLDFIGCAQVHNDLYTEREGLPSHKVSGYIQVNPYWSAEWALRAGYDVISKFYEELCNAMHGPDYYNNTDAQIDYFDCSHYVDINVGKWNKDYVYIS